MHDKQLKDEVIYLKVSISNKGTCKGEIKRRICLAKGTPSFLTRITRLVFLIATYVSETINTVCRRCIDVFGMACHRRML